MKRRTRAEPLRVRGHLYEALPHFSEVVRAQLHSLSTQVFLSQGLFLKSKPHACQNWMYLRTSAHRLLRLDHLHQPSRARALTF